MAQNISLLGASYTDVPAVELPKTGGGTASFVDVTDTTAVASDVATGKYFYTAAGVRVEGIASGGTAVISVVDSLDTYGGTIRTITATDISDTTAVASDVAIGKYFYTAAGVKTQGTGSGGGGATEHTIHLEFTDSTDTDIEVDYDDAWVGSLITSTEPTAYGQKTVDSAALDNVVWYTRPTEIWETVWAGQADTISEDPYPYFWISAMSDVYPTEGEVWRVTINNDEYVVTAFVESSSGTVMIGNTLYYNETDNGVQAPFCLYNAGWGAFLGNADLIPDTTYRLKFEKRVSV